MSPITYEQYRDLRAKNSDVPASTIVRWLRAVKKTDIKLVNGQADVVRKGWSIRVRVKVDENADTSHLGTLTDKRPCTVEHRSGAVVFRSPSAVAVRNPGRNDYHYFEPQITAAEHAAGLHAMGFSRGESNRLGREYVLRDMKRLLAVGSSWEPVGVVVRVYREGVELGSASLWGIESDAGDYLNEVAEDMIAEALEQARATRRKLCKCKKPHAVA